MLGVYATAATTLLFLSKGVAYRGARTPPHPCVIDM